MGFINNTSYILNAVLTKKGKEYLSKSGGEFKITKFALSDDEVDYSLWNTAHPKGTNYYGAVIESTPMIEPCVDPEVVMKYKLVTVPEGSRAIPYISNVTPSEGLVGTNFLSYEINADNTISQEEHPFTGITTLGAQGAFTDEKYSFLILNRNVVDIGGFVLGVPDYTMGSVIGDETTGRLSKRLIGNSVSVKAQPLSSTPGELKTSLIITGQRSGAVYVVPITVKYIYNAD